MKKGGGHRKGSAFERRVARLLDIWWEVPKNTFWRTVQSGGWQQPGDLSIRINQGENIWWPLVVECKHYHSIDFWQILKKSKKILLHQWWGQVTKDQHKFVTTNFPIRLLIIRQNNSPISVVFNPADFNAFPYIGNEVIKLEFTLPTYGYQTVTILPWKVFSVYYRKNMIKEHYHG